VPRPYLSAIIPFSPKVEVDCGSDSPVESFVFLLLIIRIVNHHYYMEVIALFMIFLANITIHRYNLLVMMLGVLALINVCFDSIVRILKIYSCRLS